MNLVFYDVHPITFYPFTLTRPVSEIRIGILTIREKWEHVFKAPVSWKTEPHLSRKFSFKGDANSLYINSSVLANESLFEAVKELNPGQKLLCSGKLIAWYPGTENPGEDSLNKLKVVELKGPVDCIETLWDIFLKNDNEIKKDFKLLTKGRNSAGDRRWAGTQDLFIEKGAIVSASHINTSAGPVYIGKDAEVMEGALIRGPFALCEHSTLKMGAKIYGATTIGPHSKVGGEVKNSVIFGFSNKAHEGFLGDAVIGEWCNLGADTNNSNLKNNYGKVKVWNYELKKMAATGIQFCGLFMGDFSKSGINTMFNTGTVTGVSANVFGSDFPPKYIPSFSWGGAAGFQQYDLEKAFQDIAAVKLRRAMPFSNEEQAILRAVYEMKI
ncbi:MAG: GlmU family protein [Bacteroidia bacterium]|nr:GlmU family protein [Bacteroidia bacterium]MCZ2277326.1 GlmU family protein [Bacteroidia bacterium]